MSSPQDNPLASLPSVDVVLQHLAAQPAGNGIPRPLLADCVRQAIQSRRAFLATASQDPATPVPADRETLIREIAGEARRLAGTLIEPHYRQAINATGIILHTGLGRAVLPEPALARVGEQLVGYSVLQVDATSGKRSRRDARIEWLVHKLTGAEAATVVNNNAAATMIVLNSVAQG
ncbi:MAG: L-seryl-tRNA(Sec) selenium transferase, partial [Gammaproteobacteria bacterium]|nr:L-seryl-tRNA(Sec) selenium transferase [Gammaproteobacteria bacterium]